MKFIKNVLFDFGGVLAEEGFKKGMEAIALEAGINPSDFFKTAEELVYTTGYVLGRVPESDYWQALKKATGLEAEEACLRREILDRFILRPEMFRLAEHLKNKGLGVGILSDQTNWLEELDRKFGIFKRFDLIFNSYRSHKTKRDPSWFAEIASELGSPPEMILFVDDNLGNVGRAAAAGWRTIHFQNEAQFREALAQYPDLNDRISR